MQPEQRSDEVRVPKHERVCTVCGELDCKDSNSATNHCVHHNAAPQMSGRK